jgi:hypothetical protein
VQKGCLRSISGEFHYKDLHPKVKKRKKKKKGKPVAKKLEWFVLVFGNTPHEPHMHTRTLEQLQLKKYTAVVVGVEFLSSWPVEIFKRKAGERVTFTEKSVADW